jgi:hypothetical protein
MCGWGRDCFHWQTAVAVPDAVVSAAAGGCHSVALTVDGAVYTWWVLAVPVNAVVFPCFDLTQGCKRLEPAWLRCHWAEELES